MSLIIKIILLAGLLSFHAAFASNVCNMNGDWYLRPGMINFVHFKQTGELLEGNIDVHSSLCSISLVGVVGEDGITFRTVYVGNQCPDFDTVVKAHFAPNCTSFTGSYTAMDPNTKYPITMYRVPVKIIEPVNDIELIITDQPSMPELTFKAKLLPQWGIAENISPFTWGINFKHAIFSDFNVVAKEVETIDGLFKPDFGNLIDLSDLDNPNRPVEGNVMGGELTVSVTFYKNLHDEKKYLLKGTNPGQVRIESVITNKTLRQIACQESRYRQFDARREGGIGNPLIGGKKGVRGGAGMMQLYDPAPTPEQVWNWRENIKAAMILYNKKHYAAVAWPKSELDKVNEKRLKIGLRACKSLPPLNAEQIERETLRRYNCGVEYRWEPWDEPDCNGKWVIDPSCRISNPKAYDAEYVNNVLACNINK